MRRRHAVTAAVLLGPAAFLAVFFGLPVVTIVGTGLRPEGRWDLSAVVDVVADPQLRRVAWFTTWQAAASTAATIAVGLPIAFALGRLEFRGRRLLQSVIIVPFVLPTVVVGTAFLALLGPDGPVAAVVDRLGVDDLDLRRTVPALIAAHVFFNVAVVARTVGAAWSQLDRDVEDAAATLGASRWSVFRRVTLPLALPALGGAAAIVFLFSFTSFGVIKILGGPQLATLEVEIHRLTTQLLDLETAAALSLVQLAAVVAALAVHQRLVGGRRDAPDRASVTPMRRPVGVERIVLAAAVLLSAVILVAPIATLVERSFATSDGYGLDFYRSLDETRRGTTAFVPPVEAIRNSLGFAVAAAAIALVVGTLTSFGIHRLRRSGRALADAAFMLPLGTSAVTLGFGFLIALDDPPLDLRASPILIPIAQALIAVPFVVRVVLPALDAVAPELRDAAATLGAAPVAVLRTIDLALLRRPLAVAAGFAAAISLGEFGATVFIARADVPTVPVAIFRSLSQPGALSVGQAMALSTILMAMTATVMVVVDRASGDRVGSF